MSLRHFCPFLLLFVIICVFWLEIATANEDYEKYPFIKHEQTMEISLRRQRSARDQQAEYGKYVKRYGHDFDLTKKKHHKRHKYDPNRTNDSIALKRYLDNEFYGEVVIGHPGQKMNVAFDTAWTYSWIISSRCNDLTAPGCAMHNKYNHDKSSEYNPDGRPFVADEGSYNISGFYSYDNFSIAHVFAEHQSFIEITYLPLSFMFNKADGVLGLGFKKADEDYDPFFITLLKNKKIRDPIFSIFLNRDIQSKKGGNIMLGFVEKRHIWHYKKNNITYYANITYLPVDSESQYWKFKVDKILYHVENWKAIGPINKTYCASGCDAIADTSSTAIIGPAKDVNDIHDIIEAKEDKAGRFSVNCDDIAKFPRIEFVIDGKNFTLTGKQYTTKITNASISHCVSSFMPAKNTGDLWVLGGSFLAEYYSIYDLDKKRIGLVKAA